MARRNFEEDTTLSPPTSARIDFTRADGVKASASVSYRPISQTTGYYTAVSFRDATTGEIRTSDVMTRRVADVTSVLAAINPSLCKSYLDNGITPNLGAPSFARTITTITTKLGIDGPVPAQEVVDEYLSQFAFAGGVGIQDYVINGQPVLLNNALVHVSSTITEYDVNEFAGITKTKVTRYLAWGTTAEGRDLASAVASQAETPGEVVSLINAMTDFVCDGTSVQTVLGRDFGLQTRPSEQAAERQRIENIFRGQTFVADDFSPGPDFDFEDIDFDLGLVDDGFTLPDSDDPTVIDIGDWDLPTTEPPAAPDFGDTWIDASTDDPFVWDGEDWVSFNPGPPDDLQEGDRYLDSETDLFYIFDGEEWIRYSDEEPEEPELGDRYIDPETGREYIWNGVEWLQSITQLPPYLGEPAPDPELGDQYIDRNTGLLFTWDGERWRPGATGAITRPDPPSAPTEGDKWIDSETGLFYFYDGEAWVTYSPRPSNLTVDDEGQTFFNPVTGELEIWDGTDWVSYQDAAIPNPEIGQRYIDSDSGQEFIWDGEDWSETERTWPQFTNDPPEPLTVGDDWLNPADDTYSRWNGSDWIPYSETEPLSPVLGDRYIAPSTGDEFEFDGAGWVATGNDWPVLSSNPPVSPDLGETWFNPVDTTLSLWDGTDFVPYLDTAPDPLNATLGDLYINKNTGDEFEFDGGDWVATGNDWPRLTSNAPSDLLIGDKWISRETNQVLTWDGEEWSDLPAFRPLDPPPGETWVDPVTKEPEVWDGSNWNAYSEDPPSSPELNDTWVQPSTGIQSQWDGEEWVATGVEFGSTSASNLQLTGGSVVRTTTVELPFANDDTLAAQRLPGNIWRQWVVPGGAQEQAIALGRLENAFRYGSAYGANVVVEAWNMPSEPLAPFTVRAGGLEVQYLVDGPAWEFDGDMIVASCDGILCGATGRIAGERIVPWVAAKVNLSNLPAVPAATVNANARPANTIPTPGNFRASRPGGVWNILPTNGVDSFEQSGTPELLFPPFSRITADRLVSRSRLEEGELDVGLQPIVQELEVLGARALLEEPDPDPAAFDLSAITYTQSSAYEGTTAANNSIMTDGSVENSGAATDDGPDQFIQMDLGAVFSIDRIVIGTATIYIPGGWDRSYTSNRTVQHSVNGTTWTDTFNTGVFEADGIFTFDVDVEARFVRIIHSGNDYIGLTEFYALPAGYVP
jgi:hypothetical protein